jgi:hypothetical protein
MALYDVYVSDFWASHPQGKEAFDSVETVHGYDFHDTYNADRALAQLNRMPQCLRNDGAEVYAATDGRIIEVRYDNSYGKFTAAIFPDADIWREYERPMSFVTWATR